MVRVFGLIVVCVDMYMLSFPVFVDMHVNFFSEQFPKGVDPQHDEHHSDGRLKPRLRTLRDLQL